MSNNIKLSIGEAKKGGVKSRAQLYQYSSQFAEQAIDKLVWLMNNAKQENVSLSAAGRLLDKCLPDLKADELSSLEPIQHEIELVPEFRQSLINMVDRMKKESQENIN